MSRKYDDLRATTGIETCLVKVKRAYTEMARILRENPHCLDGNQQKSEVVQMLIDHLAFRIKLSKEGAEAMPNRRSSVVLFALLECYEEGKNPEYAKRVLDVLLDLSGQELKYVPTEYKEQAFQICEQLLKGEI